MAPLLILPCQEIEEAVGGPFRPLVVGRRLPTIAEATNGFVEGQFP